MRSGAPFARVIMALSLSTIMTSTVAGPMAFQAHTARSGQSDELVSDQKRGPEASVLGTSKARDLEATEGEIVFSPEAPGEKNPEVASVRPLDGARLAEPSYLMIPAADLAAARFSLDDRPVEISSTSPGESYPGVRVDPNELTPGSHTVEVELTYESGRTGTFRATFTTLRR